MVAPAKDMFKAVGTVMGIAVLITFCALIIQTILELDIVASITIINTTLLEQAIGAFLVGIWSFFGLAGTVISIVWVVGYVKELFNPKTGLTSISS